jgi:hypothetical protein
VSVTYTPGETARDDVRLYIQNKFADLVADVRLEDEEIDRIIILRCGTASPGPSGIRLAAADALDAMANLFAVKPSIGSDKVQFDIRAQELRAGAARLRTEAQKSAVHFAGGTSVADNLARASDTDRPASTFFEGQFDNR